MSELNKATKTLAELAQLLNAELRGDPSCIINGVGTLQNAQSGQLSFLHSPKYRQQLASTRASVVILSADEAKHCKVDMLISKNPYLSYAKVAELFDNTPLPTAGIHPTAVIGENTQIHPSASVGPFCVIGSNVMIAERAIIGAGCAIGNNSSIGAATRLWDRVTLYHDVQVGQHCIVHSGTVIGSDGFGLAQENGIWHKIPQLGGVVIGNDVEIGANTAIDRGALDDTIIEDGVKLDNHVQIGHNVRIGAHTAIAGCTGIAGSTTIGKYCAIGGGVGIIGHLTITDKVMITAASGIGHSLTEPGVYSSGIEAQPALTWRKNVVRLHQLDNYVRKLHELEEQMNQLKTDLKKEESSL